MPDIFAVVAKSICILSAQTADTLIGFHLRDSDGLSFKNESKGGIAQGRRPELIGGDLIHKTDGWSVVKKIRCAQDHMKSDERILGDGEFTQFVLDPVKRGGKIANAEQLELELVKEYKVIVL